MAKEYHIFISHSWGYSQYLENLRTLLKERSYFNVEFEEPTVIEPINSTNAEYIKRKIKEKLNKSNIVLAIAGMYASYSDWIEWKLDCAKGLGLPIVGIIPWRQERISSVVYSHSKEDVRWNTESIVKAIRKWAS